MRAATEALEARQRAEAEAEEGGGGVGGTGSAAPSSKPPLAPTASAGAPASVANGAIGGRPPSPAPSGSGGGGKFMTPNERALAASTDASINSLEAAIAALAKKSADGGRAPKSLAAALSAGIPTRVSRADRARRAQRRRERRNNGGGGASDDDDDSDEGSDNEGGGGGASTGGGTSSSASSSRRLRPPRRATDDETLVEAGRIGNDVGGMSFAGAFLLQRVASLASVAVIDLSYNLFESFPVKLLHYELTGLVSIGFHGNKVANFARVVDLALGIVPDDHIPAALAKERSRIEAERREQQRQQLHGINGGSSSPSATPGAGTNGGKGLLMPLAAPPVTFSFGTPPPEQQKGASSPAGGGPTEVEAVMGGVLLAFVPTLERLGMRQSIDAFLETPDDCVFPFRTNDAMRACFSIAGGGGVGSSGLSKQNSAFSPERGCGLPLPHGTPFFKPSLASPLQLRLRSLTLQGCPIEQRAAAGAGADGGGGATVRMGGAGGPYRQKLLLLFPSLTSLDNNPVTVAERSLIM